MTLLGVIIGGVHSYIAIIGCKNLLHTTTYLIISPEPIVVPPQKFYHTWTMTQLLFTKQFEAAVFEILIIKVFNQVLSKINYIDIP